MPEIKYILIFDEVWKEQWKKLDNNTKQRISKIFSRLEIDPYMLTIHCFIDYLEFVAPILRGEIPTYTGKAGTSESELKEIKIPSIDDVLGEACAQLSVCK